MSSDEIKIQRKYYATTAHKYDGMHGDEYDEHGFGFTYMLAAADHLGIRSILDIGTGTGRTISKVKVKLPSVNVIGIEPSAELREIGYHKGLSKSELREGDAMNLSFDDASIDLVCAFGVLHHIRQPAIAVAEMIRVSRKAIFISDSNNFGQGGLLSRLLKQAINSIGFWPIADRIKTKGKGYTISEGDGLAYSYSVFNNYKQIAAKCQSVHMLNTANSGPNLYRTASHIALLGVKS